MENNLSKKLRPMISSKQSSKKDHKRNVITNQRQRSPFSGSNIRTSFASVVKSIQTAVVYFHSKDFSVYILP
jgi:hypothetical protein